MPFHEKLDLLMKVQGVSNSRLAKALAVDPSLISRWRTGSRKPAKNNNYIKDISTYFASHARMDYQKTALFEIMGIEYNKNREKIYSISDLLYSWLSEESSPDRQFIEAFFNKLNTYNNSNNSFSKTETPNSLSANTEEQPDFEVFYGIEGKRKGVIKFLSTVAAQEKPCTMLLYSDENMEWLTGDKSFYLKWKMLLKEVIAKGHKIKIIHTIKRDLSEMLAAIEYWLPLYMTGAIEPYYYPKYQEHIFRRTMFIAPDVAALTSNTLSEHAHKAEQLFYRDPEKIKNLVKEYNTFLSMCRTLMRIFTDTNTYNFHNLQLEFEEQSGNVINLSDMLSFVTMPQSLLIKLIDQNTGDEELKKAVLSIHKERLRTFINNIKHNQHTEIVTLPMKSDFSENNNPIKPNDFFSELSLNYTPADYSEHIENIIHLLKTYKNYNLLIIDKTPAANTFLTAKDEVGAIVGRNNASPIIFAFNQPQMTNAFNVYLEYIIKNIHRKERSKKYIIKTLRKYVDDF